MMADLITIFVRFHFVKCDTKSKREYPTNREYFMAVLDENKHTIDT